MSWTKMNGSKRVLFAVPGIIGLAILFLWAGSSIRPVDAQSKRVANDPPKIVKASEQDSLGGSGTTFQAESGTLGTIPDGGTCPTTGTPREVDFIVSGLSGVVSDVQITTDFVHTWVGDLSVTLVAPNSDQHIIFSRTESSSTNCFGDSSNLGETYGFNDFASGQNWWDAAFNTDDGFNIPGGAYRTTAPGPDDTPPADETVMSAAFAGVTNANGTWKLRITDGSEGDTGSIDAASLTLTTAAASGRPNVDADGDGKTDWSIARDASVMPGVKATEEQPAGPMRYRSLRERVKARSTVSKRSDLGGSAPSPGTGLVWYANFSGDGSNNDAEFGDPVTDFLVPADYDGDGEDDVAVWRPVSEGQPNGNAWLLYLKSSDSTVGSFDFGQTNDDPAIAGDYDGDGTDDPAVLRCPLAVPGQCTFYYRGSAGAGEITYVPWGWGTVETIFAAPGDFDGDGRYDFCVQRTAPGAALTGVSAPGQFVLLRSSDSGVEYINWG
ncbi:MAG: hypothetical protein OEM82_06805, partial [Acidobacteriota bacterium]|nr:hypothetical protein [Acidobacteriota bacterium]